MAIPRRNRRLRPNLLTLSRDAEFMDDDFRDPVEILNGAIKYVIESRGALRSRGSMALAILESRKHQLEMGCVDDLLGETAKAKGMHCPCPRHLENHGEQHPEISSQESESNVPSTERKPQRRSGKDFAAGERDE